MSRKVVKSLSVGVLVFLFSFYSLPFAHAQTLGAVAFTSFKADVVVNEDATIEVDEFITGEFSEPRHGIFRSIPVEYVGENGMKQSIHLEVERVRLNGAKVNYSAYREGPYQVIKIGDADVTFDGPFEYEIVYKVSRAILYHEETDELYWNVTGSDWGSNIPSVDATVRVPGVLADQFGVSCYVGAYGSTSQDCTSSVEDGMVTVHGNDFLTVSVQFPKGVVREPTASENLNAWLQDNWPLATPLIPITAAILLSWYWWMYGRDRRSRSIVPQYEPPDNLRPTEVGTLIDGKLHDRDFSAAIIDLAVRGHLRIEDIESKTLGFKNHEYVLHRTKHADGGLQSYEQQLLEHLFLGGDEVRLSGSSQAQVVASRKMVEHDVYTSMAERNYFVADPKKTRATFAGFGVVILFIAYFFFSSGVPGILIASLAATGALFFLFAPIMTKKTEKGQLAYEHAKGFKMFLEKAEKYRIQWQEREGIFEKYLPYAMVFGVADKWATALADVAKEQPNWYTGNLMMFNAMAFSDRMSGLASAAAAASAPKSSGGGGGGGFSGGGFGGGGGGSW